jgi:hypothetical protein
MRAAARSCRTATPRQRQRETRREHGPHGQSSQSPEHHDGVAQVAELFGEELELTPRAAQSVKVGPDALRSSKDLALDGSKPDLPLDIGSSQLGEGVCVALLKAAVACWTN